MDSSTLPGLVNFKLYRGDTFRRSLTVTDDLDAAWDFTGAAVSMRITTPEGRSVMTLSDGDGVEISTNIVSIEITDEDTALLAAGNYRHEIRYAGPGGDERAWLSGAFVVMDRL